VQFDGPVLELVPDARTRVDPRLASLGPDVLGESFDEQRFLGRLRSEDARRPIGDALIDQRLVAGVGNYWKSEACFAVGVDPWRAQSEVDDERALALVRFARERMARSAELGPRARPHAVYGRAGQPCPRCDAPIRSRGQGEGNRVTFWCAACQR
jgi:endonuclease-8